MTTEVITASDSPDGSEGVLALILRPYSGPPAGYGLRFLSDPSWGQQLAHMRYAAGKEVPRHYHPPAPRTVYGTPETLVVRSGVVDLDVYTSAGERVTTVRLGPGDVVMLLAGGHGLRVVADADILEIKQGPWLGDKDKVRF